ncbi:MAG: YggS family pyridoxal phosphate-dependent enzyme [Candidatus Omnitrophica bacterium]|nr:YggS family pyridoxal phosphate-dependent enzyme [Candidatus Omnitrophota bacterium]
MIKENILKVNERIRTICAMINRAPSSITVVAVAKGRSVQEAKEAINAGITDIGENRVQEAILKYKELKTAGYKLRNHMVGHLQTNKVKDAVRIFDLIHSVDSLRLAQAIDKEAAKIGKVQDILIEVKTSPEATKFGVPYEGVFGFIKEVSQLKNITIRGLMTIAPLTDNPQKARPYFKKLRELKDEINGLRITNCNLQILSMGMTDDFEVAIEEGADMLRLGRVIFGG